MSGAGTEVRVDAPQGELPTYVAEPDGDAAGPAVIVIHDAFGMTTDLRNQVDWLAGEGYLAAGPDLFHWGGQLRCIRTVMGEISAGAGRSFDEVEAVRSWLSAHPRSNGKVGVIGFCMGGGFALVLAPGHGFDAASVNYASSPKRTYTADFLRGACPIVGSFGGRDLMLRGAADRLEASLTKLGVDHDVKEYASAGHSFLNDHDPADLPLALSVLVKLPLPGMGFHEPSAVDAKSRIVAFFDRHLRA
jgi:carboxymethylenebutenolidase